MKVTIEHEITKETVANLLSSALEGGSNYWYGIVEFHEPLAMTFRTDPDQVFRHIDYPMNEGGSLLISSLEEPDRPAVTLNLTALQRGLQLMADKYPKHFADVVAENDDATTADVFLQLCLYGEVVYG